MMTTQLLIPKYNKKNKNYKNEKDTTITIFYI